MSIFKGKGMYELINKNKKKLVNTKIEHHKDPTPIFSADTLLSTEKRQQAISDIRALLSLPDEEFNRFFKTVTENFAEFVQNLPETQKSYYAGIGGLLDHALERASLSLFLCRTYLLPEDSNLASVPQEEMIWVYAVYTAALLYDVGKVPTTHVITLTDENGKTIKNWLPYAGSMTQEPASHYVFGFSEEHRDHMRWKITALLARQIMPKEGFDWLASDNDVLESWLALLSDEQRQVGSLMTVIPLADAQLLESFFSDKKIFRHSLSPQTIALLSKLQKDRKELTQRLKELREKILGEQVDKANQNLADTKTEETKKTKQSLFGFPSLSQQDREQSQSVILHDAKDTTRQFLNWIQDKIEKKSVSVNQTQSLVQAAKEGVVIDQRLLQQFISENNIKQMTAQDLANLLTQSQISQPVSYAHAVQLAQQTGQFNPAILVQNPYMVFPAAFGPPPVASAGMITVVKVPGSESHHDARPHIDTAQQTYEKEVAHQQQRPNPTYTPKGR